MYNVTNALLVRVKTAWRMSEYAEERGSNAMANEEQLAILKQGEKVWNQLRLEQVNIRPDLSRADLSEANLIGADLYFANLNGTRLIGADLYRADLWGADLSKADLSKADLIGADLSKADLT